MKNFLLFLFWAMAMNVQASDAIKSSTDFNNSVHEFLQEIFKDNLKNTTQMTNEELKSISTSQAPRATLVTCSDSRVQTKMIDETPVNDLFVVRNIGNQLETAMGSVEYGVRHLHTPVLLIIGHVECGAIKAAIGDYSKLEAPIRKELDTIHLSNKTNADLGIVENIHNQVQTALKKFANEIANHQLVVIGAIYDFKNQYKQGYNRLIVVDLNGETDPTIIKQNPKLQGIESVAIGVNSK